MKLTRLFDLMQFRRKVSQSPCNRRQSRVIQTLTRPVRKWGRGNGRAQCVHERGGLQCRVLVMMEHSNALSDRNLEANTTLSLKREPACFAFLSSRAVSAPMPIDAINLDLASVDYFSGRASLWATLEVRSGATNEQPTAVLGFDETFLRPFTRALIEASASRHPYRMTIVRDP